MSTTRATSIPKKLNALTQGAKYGTSSAGITNMGLSALGLCVAVPTPISLGIAGGVGLLFCCIGGCYELHKSDAEEVQEVPPQEDKNPGNFIRSTGMFSVTQRSEIEFYTHKPKDMEMSDYKESKRP